MPTLFAVTDPSIKRNFWFPLTRIPSTIQNMLSTFETAVLDCLFSGGYSNNGQRSSHGCSIFWCHVKIKVLSFSSSETSGHRSFHMKDLYWSVGSWSPEQLSSPGNNISWIPLCPHKQIFEFASPIVLVFEDPYALLPYFL